MLKLSEIPDAAAEIAKRKGLTVSLRGGQLVIPITNPRSDYYGDGFEAFFYTLERELTGKLSPENWSAMNFATAGCYQGLNYRRSRILNRLLCRKFKLKVPRAYSL